MALESRGRARGGKHKDTSVRIATPRGGFRAWRETIAAEGVTFPVLVGLGHLLLVQTAASLAHRFGTIRAGSPPGVSEDIWTPAPLTGVAGFLVEPLRLWDGLWYTLIADEGYGSFWATPAFWPLYPWLMRLGSNLTGLASETVGWLIARAAFILALVLLYRLVSLDFDLATARRTLIAVAFFPTALFFSAVYTESLFLVLAVGALLAARQGNWFLAGTVGLLAALTRSQGVLLLGPLAVLFLQQHGWNPKRWFPDAVYAVLPALGPVLFGWHLERQGYDFLAFVDVQQGWNRYRAWPWETLGCGIRSCEPIPGIKDGADWGWIDILRDGPTWATFTSFQFRDAAANSDVLELLATLGALGLAVVGLRMLPLYMSAYVWPPLIIPLFGPSEVHALMSMPRFILALFPLFVLLAMLFAKRRAAISALVVSCVLLVLLTMQFAQWYWVS